MSTNYYVITNVCNHCERSDKAHIGKISGGWEFMFQAFWENNPIQVDAIKDFYEWRRVLERAVKSGGHIEDEYGREVKFDDLIQMIEDTRKPWGKKKLKPQNHVDYLKIHYPSKVGDGEDFKDSEGWSFSFTDFS